MRMRTIESAYTLIKEHDPETELSKTGFRYLVTSGAIPSVSVGTKRLIDTDRAIEILSEGIPVAPQEETQKTGIIRTISEAI